MTTLLQMPDHEYRSRPEPGSTLIKALLRSPAHYQAQLAEPREPTPAMRLGTAIHLAVLEPHVFRAAYAVFEGDRRTKAGKEEWERLLTSGVEPLSADDYQTCVRIAEILRAHPVAGPLLTSPDAEAERCHFFEAVHTDPNRALKMPAKMKPDLWCPSANMDPDTGIARGYVVDLKTTDDARPEAFARTVENFGYDLQASLYLEGFASLGLIPDWVWIVVERDAPHGVRVYRASAEHIAAGYRKLDIAIERWNACTESGMWPCYEQAEIEELGRPGWAR